jgi:hypothetical protein
MMLHCQDVPDDAQHMFSGHAEVHVKHTLTPCISHQLCGVLADLLGLGLEEDPGPEVLTGGADRVLQ